MTEKKIKTGLTIAMGSHRVKRIHRLNSPFLQRNTCGKMKEERPLAQEKQQKKA
jgi:hypothetical protein